MNVDLEGKLHILRAMLRSHSSALVSYSGGVDSTLLAVLAHQELGERMAAIILASPLMPPRELQRATGIAQSIGFALQVMESDELSLPGFRHNPPQRCYICKRHRLELLKGTAESEGWGAVMDGSNTDDAAMHRPGRKASEELGCISPFEEAGIAKSDIRAMARDLGLPNWDAPARPCLATRFPHGMDLEHRLMRRVDAAEMELESLGLREFRVRLQSPDEARIEIGLEELQELAAKDNRARLVKKLRGLGFRRILLDLEGYRSGSMDSKETTRRCRTLYIAEG
jgi:uncharacterized protein